MGLVGLTRSATLFFQAPPAFDIGKARRHESPAQLAALKLEHHPFQFALLLLRRLCHLQETYQHYRANKHQPDESRQPPTDSSRCLTALRVRFRIEGYRR